MRLLLERKADGVGDWLFMLAAMKHVNRDFPELEIVVNFDKVKTPLPKIILEAYFSSDVRWRRFDSQTDKVEMHEPRIEHAIYPTGRHAIGEPYIKGMVDQIGRILTRKIEYDPGLVPLFRGSGRPMMRDTLAPKGHVLICPSPKQIAKDWGWDRYNSIAERLERDHPDMAIVSVGSEHEKPVGDDVAMHGLAFPTLLELMFSARAIVCGENCLAVLAGWLSTPTVVIYMRGDLHRLEYPCLTKTLRPDPFHVHRLVTELLAR